MGEDFDTEKNHQKRHVFKLYIYLTSLTRGQKITFQVSELNTKIFTRKGLLKKDII